VHESVNSLYKLFCSGADEELTPEKYYILAGKLSDMENQYSIADNRNIRFAMGLVLDLWESQKRILEQLYMLSQIETELAMPGSGNLPAICAIQDLHGGSHRALSLVGFCFRAS